MGRGLMKELFFIALQPAVRFGRNYTNLQGGRW